MQLPPHDPAFDRDAMSYALATGARGLGGTWPNPSVGCVIAKDGRILAAARTADGGRPHAEAQALAITGEAAQGATAYITLEPCAHHGATPPCAEALVKAGVARVVIACADPDPRVSGKGVALLRQAGIAVETGLLQAEARKHHAGFFSRLCRNRPFVAMKLATSLDGRITNAKGESTWITGEDARAYGHRLRATHDVILTGIGTVLADDPDLTCRLPGLEHRSPVRVVLDSHLRLPPDSRLARSAKETPVWVITTDTDAEKRRALERAGVTIGTVAAEDGHVSLPAALEWLAAQGVTRVLAEGGAALNGSLWRSGLADALYWFRAPIVLGDSGTPAIAAAVEEAPSALPRMQREDTVLLGEDMLEVYGVAAS